MSGSVSPKPLLTDARILAAVLAYQRRTGGRLPSSRSKGATEDFGYLEEWHCVQWALRFGGRGATKRTGLGGFFREYQPCLLKAEVSRKGAQLKGLPPEVQPLVVLEDFLKIRGRLPEIEARLLEGILLDGKTQTRLAEETGLTQPSVHYRIRRAVARVPILLGLLDLDLPALQDALNREVSEPLDREILFSFLETSSQSQVARKLGRTQGFIRHRLLKALGGLREVLPSDQMDIIDSVIDNPNILADLPKRPLTRPAVR